MRQHHQLVSACRRLLPRRFVAVRSDGRVEDMNEWISWSSDSLACVTGETLIDKMDGTVSTLEEVHNSERFAVLSHGIQDDPVYCYFNKGALLQFQWPEPEVYSLPSRYSAPSGTLREGRELMMKTVVDQDVRVIERAIRLTKDGSWFELTNVTLWNVYDPRSGKRVGQTAIFDRDLIIPLPEAENDVAGS